MHKLLVKCFRSVGRESRCENRESNSQKGRRSLSFGVTFKETGPASWPSGGENLNASTAPSHEQGSYPREERSIALARSSLRDAPWASVGRLGGLVRRGETVGERIAGHQAPVGGENPRSTSGREKPGEGANKSTTDKWK